MTPPKNHVEPVASTEPVIVEMVGTGADTKSIVRVADWTLTAFTGRGDDEPRIRDLDLAERLAYADPHKIRTMIRRHAKAGNVAPLSATVAETRGRPGQEFWLSEADALFIVTQSETVRAVAVTKEMICVYMLARHGMLPRSSAIDPVLLSLVKQQGDVLALIARRLDSVEERLANDTGVCGDEWAAELRERLRRIANVGVGAQPRAKLTKPARGYLRRVENILRAEFDFTGRGCAWKNFPKGKVVRMLARRLEAFENEAIACGRTLPDPRQMPLRAIK